MRFGRIAPIALIFAATTASAAEADDNYSRGHGALKWESRKSIPGPTSDKIGASTLQVEVGADLDPMKDPAKPLLLVDMTDQVLLQATWQDDKTIDLTTVDASSNLGSFKVDHTLAPHIKIYLDAFGFKLTYDYDATTLLSYIPGSNWNYEGLGSTTFTPWGFDAAHLKVKAPLLEDAELFSIPIPNIGGSNPLTGTLAINATTAPTFDYQTQEVQLEDGKIVAKTGKYTIPTTDQDYIEIPAQVTGEIAYTGTLVMRPSITVTAIGGYALPFPLTLDITQAGVSLPYASQSRNGIKVDFPLTTFHIPLPNVHALKTLDLGSVVLGANAAKQANIDNSGEMKATYTAKSSDPQFVVAGGKQIINSKDKSALGITFTPAKSGLQTADITITSNDPNEPVQVIKVQGIGTDKPAPAAEPEAPFERGDVDSGCGCRTATGSSPLGALGLAGVGLALGAVVARRRRR